MPRYSSVTLLHVPISIAVIRNMYGVVIHWFTLNIA